MEYNTELLVCPMLVAIGFRDSAPSAWGVKHSETFEPG